MARAEGRGRSDIWLDLREIARGDGVHDGRLRERIGPDLAAYWGIDLRAGDDAWLRERVIAELRSHIGALQAPADMFLNAGQLRSIVRACFNIDTDRRRDTLQARQRAWAADNGLSLKTVRRAFERGVTQLEMRICSVPPRSPLPGAASGAHRRRRRVAFLADPVFLGGVAFAALAVLVITGAFYVRGELTRGGPSPGPGHTAGLRVSVDTNPSHLGSQSLQTLYSSAEAWMVPPGTPVTGRPRGEESGPDNFYLFAKSLGGVAAGRLFFSATVQNVSGGVVHLTSMRLADLRCGTPLRGTLIFRGGGAELQPPRIIIIDLDDPRPRPLFFKKAPQEFLDGDKAPAGRADPFGFRLPPGDSESFEVVAEVTGRSCSFRLVIETVVDGRSGPLVISDAGRPFRVTHADDSYWFYTPDAWTRYRAGTSTDEERPVGTGGPLPQTHP